jgi:hypothetical protein
VRKQKVNEEIKAVTKGNNKTREAEAKKKKALKKEASKPGAAKKGGKAADSIDIDEDAKKEEDEEKAVEDAKEAVNK